MNIHKKKMLQIMYIYIALIILLLFFSKTIYNFSLPKVSVAMPKTGKLTKELEANGIVAFSDIYNIYSSAAGQIEEIQFKHGDFIDSNETIAVFKQVPSETDYERKSLEFLIDRYKNQLDASQLEFTALQEEIEVLLDNETFSPDMYSPDIYSVPARELQAAEWSIELQETERLIAIQKGETEKANILYEAGVISKADYEAEIEELTVLEYSKTQKELQIAKQTQEMEAQIAKQEQDNHKKYEEDRKNHLELLRHKETELAKVNLSIERIYIDIAEAEAALAMLLNHENNNPAIKSEYSGIVVALEKEKGSFVSKGEKIATVGVYNHSFISEIICSKSDGGFIEVGDSAMVHYGGKNTQSTAVVYEIQPESDTLRIKLRFDSEQLTGGEYITAKFHQQTANNDVLVPNEAVFREGFNNFVWVVRSKSGTLGTEYYAVKIRVMIADSDFHNTAISKGLEYFEPVVIGSDKDLTMNGRVRQMD